MPALVIVLVGVVVLGYALVARFVPGLLVTLRRRLTGGGSAADVEEWKTIGRLAGFASLGVIYPGVTL